MGSEAVRKRDIHVLGCGPAGLFAALAAEHSGHNVVIHSRKKKSPLHGMQFLHRRIPELTSSAALLRHELWGDPGVYAAKLAGRAGPDEPRMDARWPAGSDEDLLVFDLREAYDVAWVRFKNRINDVDVTPEWFMSPPWGSRDRVIWSIPLKRVCRWGHAFHSTDSWVSGAGIGDGYSVGLGFNTVVLNGLDNPSWLRAGDAFGHRSVEWPLANKPPVDVLRLVNPVATNCDCFTADRQLLRVGRYGRWNAAEMAHDAYWGTARWLG